MRIFNLAEELEKERKKNKELQDRIDKVMKYIKETRESDSCTRLPSGKITDIGYCLEALEDIEDLLNGEELKGE